MAAKMTLQSYTAALATLNATIESCCMIRDEYELAADEPMSAEERGDLTDAWNALHDQIADLKLEVEALDREWNQRDWTGADFASYALVCANVD